MLAKPPVAPVIVSTVQFCPPFVVRMYNGLIELIPQHTLPSNAVYRAAGFTQLGKPNARCNSHGFCAQAVIESNATKTKAGKYVKFFIITPLINETHI